MRTSGGIYMEENRAQCDVTSTQEPQPVPSQASASISDAEQHHSDPPEPVAVSRACTCLQLPRVVLASAGSDLAKLCVGTVFPTLAQALAHGHPAVGGLFVRQFYVGGFASLNAVRKNGKDWRSVSVRGHGARGVLSLWKHLDGRHMVAYRDGAAVRAWVDMHRMQIDPELWNAIMHALNGNTSNYWAPLVGLSASSAAEVAEELQAREDGFEGPGESILELDDGLVVGALESLGRPFVNRYVAFNKKFCPSTAAGWNTLHAIVDSSVVDDEELSRGVKFAMINGPKGERDQKEKKPKKRTGERSKAMKVRDASRLAKWLKGLDAPIAEGWVRAVRPDAAVVPRATPYLEAYSSRRTKHDFYAEESMKGTLRFKADEYTAMIPMFIKDAVRGEVEYMGPMSRALIQSLLAIGNIELNPGPVAGLSGANFGIDGSDLELAFAGGVHYLLHSGVPGDAVHVGGLCPMAIAAFHPLARPCLLPAPAPGGNVTLGQVGGDYVIGIGWADAKGSAHGGQYERVWRGGQWAIEYTGQDGTVLVFPDLDGLGGSHTLLAKLFVRDAAGKADITVPPVLVYSDVVPMIPRTIHDRRNAIIVNGLAIHYYRGCNHVAVVCEGRYAAIGVVPTPLWAECEKLYASGHSRQVAANNATQVLRTCEGLDGGMLGVIQLAISEAMLPSAMVVASVSSGHRDAAINRARLGKGPPSAFEVAWRGSVAGPDYGAMVRNSSDAPWEAVWAIRGTACVGVLCGAYFGARWIDGLTRSFLSSSYVAMREEALRVVQSIQPVREELVDRVGGFTYEQYTDGGYQPLAEFYEAAVATTEPQFEPGIQAMVRRWLSGYRVASLTAHTPALTDSQFAEMELRSVMRLYERVAFAGERAQQLLDEPKHEAFLHASFAVVCRALRRGLELTQSLRDFWSGADIMRVSMESVTVLLGHIVVTAPLSEEYVKRRHRVFYYGIPFVEAMGLVNSGWSAGAALLNRYVIHCGFAALPFWAGVAAHSCFNLAVLTTQMNIQSGEARLVYAAAPVVSLVALQGIDFALEKGVKWWASKPMGVGSQFDELIGTPHVADTDPLLKVMVAPRRPRYGKRSKNMVYQLFPSVLDMASFSNERGNYVHSMHGRVGKITPQIVDDVGLDAIKETLRSLADSVRARQGLVEPLDFDEFVGKFGPAKRQAYIEARELFDVVGTQPIRRPKRFKDFKADECAAFLKHELNPERPDVVKVYAGKRYTYAASDPRTICPRWLPFQSQMIPYVLAMEKSIKTELRERSPELFGVEVRFASGLSIEEMSEMCSALMAESGLDCIIDNGDDGMFTVNGVAYYVDGHRWDAHFRREYHHEIIDCYARMGLPSFLTEAMHILVYRKLDWGQGVRCEIDRNNASGESDTTFRNGLGNFVVKLIALRRSGRFAGPGGAAFVAAATRLGFVYEVAAVQRVCFDPYGDFCARVWLGRQLVLKPGRIFSKLCWTCSPSIPFEELRAAKLRAAVMDFAAFPEIASLLSTVDCGVVTERGMAAVAAARYGVIGSRDASSFEDRQRFFSLRYGLDYDDVLGDVSRWAGAVDRSDFEVSLPFLRRMAEVDMGVTSSPVIAAITELKLVRPAWCPSESSARARRMLHEASQSRGRPGWLADAWNALMHIANGNGRRVCAMSLMSVGVLLACMYIECLPVSVGWEGGGNLSIVPEQTLGYQRQRQFIMPNKGKRNNNNNAAKGQTPSFPKNQKSRKKSNAKPAARAVRGDGMYKMLAPLAKMAVQAALPGALQRAGSRLFPMSMNGVKGPGDYVCNDIVHMGGGHPVKKGREGVPVTRYVHSEFIKDLVVPATPTAFVSQRFSLNSSDATTFPWLSRLASLYTKYKFTKLLFEFRSTTSNYSAAGTLGTVVMAPHYNVDSLPYLTKQTMEAATHAVSSAPSNSIILGFECAKKDDNVKWFNIINDVSVVRGNFTDPGYVEVATSGLPGTAGTVLGEIWVHYECELIEPYISQGEVSTAINTQVTEFRQAGSNMVNPLDVSVFGLQFNAVPAVSVNVGYPAANWQPSYKVSGNVEPTAGDWFAATSCDSGGGLLLRYAGTYVLEMKGRLSVAGTSSTGAPFEISAISGTVTVLSGNNSATNPIIYPSTSNWIAYRWVVSVSAGCVLRTTRGPGWLGFSAATMPDATLSISRIG